MFDPAAWRDVDSESPRLGLCVTRHTLTIFWWRRCYRVRWSGPWSRP